MGPETNGPRPFFLKKTSSFFFSALPSKKKRLLMPPSEISYLCIKCDQKEAHPVPWKLMLKVKFALSVLMSFQCRPGFQSGLP